MTIDTKKRHIKIYIILGLLFLIALAAHQIQSGEDYLYGQWGYKIKQIKIRELCIFIILLIWLCRPSYFYFDDTNALVNIRGHRILLGKYLFKRTVQFELPKRKIKNAKVIYRFLKPYLSITVNSKKGKKRIKKIDISALTRKERQNVITNLAIAASNNLNVAQK